MDQVDGDDDEQLNSLLVVILDTNPFAWNALRSSNEHQSAFVETTEHLLCFLKSYSLLSPFNQVAVIAASRNKSKFLYASELLVKPTTVLDAKKKKKLGEKTDIDSFMTRKLAKLCNNLEQQYASGNPSSFNAVPIAGALATALCYCNRKKVGCPTLQQRILVIQSSQDMHSEYIPVMNSIFSAQKNGIVLDGCMIGTEDSMFLQQACDITRGVYIRLQNLNEVAQRLIFSFLAPVKSRSIVTLPQQPLVDYRASCVCHNAKVDQAIVCSVCLAIFCKMTAMCPVCQSRIQGKKKK